MDYEKLGFRAGLEIHQQLATHKLFCNCPSELKEEYISTFERILRPTQSEFGEIDKAALEEARRGKKFVYFASSSSCLVEADEEPPHAANEEAIDVALTVALLLNADIVDEIHFMRKIVIDGSNTTGFQRTALIALNGRIDDIGIETICLEEDAARKIGEDGKKVKYALDRLGIPLVEIATAPDIKSPEQAKEIAEKIGLILRATKKVKRGIGTIRQDLNVSIKEGNRVEIKGVQELKDIPKILENEVKRQIELIEVKKELIKRGVEKKDLEKIKIEDVSKIFENTSCKFIRKALKEGVVFAIKLPSFKGVMGGIKYKEHRLGRELAMYAKMEGGGIVHSDELPNYGISKKEVEEVKKALGCNKNDAFILSVGKEKIVRKCLKAVLERAKEALKGVPREVRRALPDGMTEYMRPMSGAARMYPETDVPPIRISKQKIEKLKKQLPEYPEEKIERMVKQYKLSKEEARQLVYSGRDDLFEKFAIEYEGYEKVIARILLNVMAEIEREGYDSSIVIKKMENVLEGLKKKLFAKEAVETLLLFFAQHPEANLQEAMEKCGLKKISDKEIRNIIRNIVKEKLDFVKEKREKAISPLMGIAMKELRGKADGALVNKILREEIERVLKA